MARCPLLGGVLLLALTAGCDAERPEPIGSTVEAPELSWIEQLAELQGGKRTEIHLSHRVVTNEDWQRLAKGCQSLEVLDIESLEIESDAFACLSHLSRLRQLRIGSPIGDAELRHIASIASLRVLNLPAGEFTDDGIRQLAILPQLELFRFHSPQVTDRGLEEIAGFPSLRFLHLIEVPITDSGLRHLEGCQRLKSLYLDGCRCTDDGLLHLLQALPTLHLHRDQLHLDDDPHAHAH